MSGTKVHTSNWRSDLVSERRQSPDYCGDNASLATSCQKLLAEVFRRGSWRGSSPSYFGSSQRCLMRRSTSSRIPGAGGTASSSAGRACCVHCSELGSLEKKAFPPLGTLPERRRGQAHRLPRRSQKHRVGSPDLHRRIRLQHCDVAHVRPRATRATSPRP